MKVRKPSPGTAIALLALFFAMSGTAIAARHYLITSTKQIKPSVLVALKGNTGPEGPAGKEGLAGKEGRAGKDGKEGKEGKEGLPGKEGKEGSAGKEGAPPKLSKLTEEFEVELVAGLASGTAQAACPEGSRAVSGGFAYETEPGEPAPEMVTSKAMPELAGWEVSVHNAGKGEMAVEAIAYCGGEGEAIASSRPASSLRVRGARMTLRQRRQARAQVH